MDLSSTQFSKPKLREGVTFAADDNLLELNYRAQGCDIELCDIEPAIFNQFLGMLKQGCLTVEQLQQEFPVLSESMEDMLTEFDRLGLIQEANLVQSSGTLCGRDFYFQRLLPCIDRIQSQLGDSPLYQRMVEGKITKNELIGFALEYYHLVKMSPALISPALCHVSNESIRQQLLKLFIEEYDHDKIMIECLKAVGLEERQVLLRQPLSTSFCAYGSLGVYARQHFLSFFSALILFETPSHRFNEVFVKACKNLDFPDSFYKPLVKHSEINEDGSHDAVTLELLSEVPVISQQEQDTILIHITALIEMLNKQDRHIVEYYGKEDCDLMRVY